MAIETILIVGQAGGGVSQEIFRPGFTDKNYPGLSGMTHLDCRFTSDSLIIRDRHNPSYVFRADYDPSTKTMGFAVKTKDWNGPQTRHPDLHAGRLLKASIAYFEDQGLVVPFLRGDWRAGSDNYTAYSETLSQSRFNDEEARRLAARATWTGQQAHKLGFTEIVSVTPNPKAKRVITIFSR